MPLSNPAPPDPARPSAPARTAAEVHTIDELRAALTVIQGHTQLLGRAVRNEPAPDLAHLSRRMGSIERAVATATRCLHQLERHAR